MRRRPERHFLSHTLEHLAAVGAILLIAVSLGALGRWLGSPNGDMLAQTSGSAQLNSGTPSPGSVYQVFFGAERVGGGCSSGVTTAKYHFSIEPLNGGYIMLTTSAGSVTIDPSNGLGYDRVLPVGGYAWSGTPNSGFNGTNSGTFTVPDLCDSAANASADGIVTAPALGANAAPSDATLPLSEVSFSAQPGPDASCETGSPLTPVFFLVTKSDGGNFLVSSDTGMNKAHFEWGEYPLPNGNYSWTASVKPGFVGAGDQSGVFEIHHACPVATPPAVNPVSGGGVLPAPAPLPSTTPSSRGASAQTSLSAPSASVAIAPPVAPRLRIFVDNKPLIAGAVFNREVIELRVATPESQKVSVSSVNDAGATKVIGSAEKDDLLSKDDTDIWTYEYDTAAVPAGVYKLYASVVGKNGKVTLSERESIEVRHDTVMQGDNHAVSGAIISGNGSVVTSVHVSAAEKKAILARVSDPASCANEAECRIYCTSLSDLDDKCRRYVQEAPVAILPGGTSLADDVSPVRLAGLLADAERRPKDIPQIVNTPLEFKQYCANPSHSDACTKVLVKNDMGAPETLLAKKENIAREREEQIRIFAERLGARAYIDSDDDGVTDYDEVNIYHTDPNKRDTDGDGFPDGAELLARTNPRGGEMLPPSLLAASSSMSGVGATTTESDESVSLENPMIAGVSEPTLLAVSDVAVAELGKDASGTTTIKKLRIEGHAMPNSFVTLYIFSDPIVVTVKADETGAWTYMLDKELADGSHKVYGAITDSVGHILAKSEPLSFAKEAAAVSLSVDSLPPGSPATNGPISGTALSAMIAILIGILGVGLSVIGFIVRQKESVVNLPIDAP